MFNSSPHLPLPLPSTNPLSNHRRPQPPPTHWPQTQPWCTKQKQLYINKTHVRESLYKWRLWWIVLAIFLFLSFIIFYFFKDYIYLQCIEVFAASVGITLFALSIVYTKIHNNYEKLSFATHLSFSSKLSHLRKYTNLHKFCHNNHGKCTNSNTK